MKSLTSNHVRLRADHEFAKYHFVLTELDLAITFGNIALTGNDPLKTERNVRNAKRAYQAAKHFSNKAAFSEKMKREVKDRSTEVELLLRQLNTKRQPTKGKAKPEARQLLNRSFR